MHATRYVRWMCVLAAILLIPTAALAAVEVEGEGGADAESPTRREEALQAAQRDALSQAYGTIIESETEVRDFMAVRDDILAEARGFIEEYEVVKEWEEDGIYRVRIKALVSMEAMEKTVRLLLKRAGKPRLMVVIAEYMEGRQELGESTGNAVAGAFLKRGFQLIDFEQLGAIKARDVENAFDDGSRAMALGQRFGADIIITGKALAEDAGEFTIGGRKQKKARVTLNIKAVDANSGVLILADNDDALQASEGSFAAAARRSAQRAGENVSEKTVDRVVSYIKGTVDGMGVTLQLVLQGVDFLGIDEIQEQVEAMSNVTAVYQRDFQDETGILEVETTLTAREFAKKFARTVKEPRVRITGMKGSRIDVEVESEDF